jgi:hypothetical protein
VTRDEVVMCDLQRWEIDSNSFLLGSLGYFALGTRCYTVRKPVERHVGFLASGLC